MASDARRLLRYTRTERALHWVHATAVTILATTRLPLLATIAVGVAAVVLLRTLV